MNIENEKRIFRQAAAREVKSMTPGTGEVLACCDRLNVTVSIVEYIDVEFEDLKILV